MGKNLVIVESPAKAKTIKKYLGKDFDVVASIGHIEDLPENKLGVDIKNNFQPEYTIMKGKKKVISELKKLVKNHEKVYLATDEDREGEAIAWHLIRTLKLPENTPRIAFHEITKTAIQNAIKNPRTINLNLVNAQQGRRILDRLVGYKISPILWKKIKQGLSAGRVQSVAVRLIVEKENKIKNFKPEEKWDIKAILDKNLEVKLDKLNNQKADFKNEKEVLDFLEKLGIKTSPKIEGIDFKISPYLNKKAKNLNFKEKIDFKLIEIKKNTTSKKPPTPFITSTLQQEASSKFGRGVKTVIQVAQKLYENGYITYMRTDDVSLSPQAIKQAEKFITQTFGKEYSNPTQYKTKNKNAQEAHEAIRPTDLTKSSNELGLNGMEAKLYDLIRARTLASQMKPAKIQVTTYIFSVKNFDLWTTKGEIIVFDGFLKAYGNLKDSILPKLEKNQILQSNLIQVEQKFTKAESRYTESSLVKEMEKLGIGRPSTYASIISTIIQRGYVQKTEDKKLKPTEIAYLVVDYLKNKFSNLMDYKFTAQMENELDKIAIGKLDHIKMLSKFWDGFSKQLKEAEQGEKVIQKVGRKCSKCGGELIYKFGKFGKFIACENYPKCKYTEQTEDEKNFEEQLKAKFEGKPCPAGGTLVVKKSKNGYFLASSEYPKIKWTMAPDVFELNEKYAGEKCDKCKEGTMVVRKGKRGYFLACDTYPKCKNIKPLKIK